MDINVNLAVQKITWFPKINKFHVIFSDGVKFVNDFDNEITLEMHPQLIQIKKQSREEIELRHKIKDLQQELHQLRKQLKTNSLAIYSPLLQPQIEMDPILKLFNGNNSHLPPNYQQWFSVGLTAALKAGDLISKFIEDTFSKHKSLVTKMCSSDFQTQFDRQTEKLILNEIENAFPTHIIIAEESYNAEDCFVFTDDPTWIIDPIDGTTNFIHGHNNVGVCIGLKYKKESIIGIIHCPIWNETYFAIKGKGAYVIKNGDFQNVKEIHTNQMNSFENVSDLSNLMVLNESGFFRHEEHCRQFADRIYQWLYEYKVRAIRMFGSCSIHMCMIASGKADIFYEHGNLKPWDLVAGEVIVIEAGGCVILPETKANDINRSFDCTQGRTLCCSSKSCARVIASLNIF